uniref:UEV and lactate/malate dehyrogenase domains n=1 Tax=Monodelphis domestica TaxID=13616 RepID=A0A5F8GG56_MONDO
MEFDRENLKRQLSKYKFRDLTVEELTKVNMLYPNFRFSMDTYVFKDSSQKDLLNFTGTIPVNYQDLSASWNSKVVIFTVNSLGNSHTYLDVVQNNVDMFKELVPALGHYSPQSVILVASQPVEIMTYAAWKLSAFPENQVIGIGCNLDSKRFQYILTNVLKAQSSGNEMWIIGEQGEDKVPTWSNQEEAVAPDFWVQMSNRAMEILKVKGQRSWSVGLSISDLVDSIINNKKKVHSVSVLAKGYYNINSEVFLSLPCILGDKGVHEIIKDISKEDLVTEKLWSSASSIHSLQNQLKL